MGKLIEQYPDDKPIASNPYFEVDVPSKESKSFSTYEAAKKYYDSIEEEAELWQNDYNGLFAELIHKKDFEDEDEKIIDFGI